LPFYHPLKNFFQRIATIFLRQILLTIDHVRVRCESVAFADGEPTGSKLDGKIIVVVLSSVGEFLPMDSNNFPLAEF
jgi:hypothetical protein